MIHSLKRYIRFFFVTLFLKKEKLILFNHWIDYFISKRFLHAVYSIKEKEQALDLNIQWLLKAKTKTNAHGMGTYYITKGWTSPYPETTGYILATLARYAFYYPEQKQNIHQVMNECADWLVTIQKPSGGWQSGYVHQDKTEVVFNTGQVLRGLLVAFEIDPDEKYTTSMIKACDWLVNTQEENGSWLKTAFMQQPRVYDSYVSHPLLQVYALTGKEAYKNAAIKNLDWILTQQKSNGWFVNADNTQKHNDRPILHTISYTIDGLIHCGEILGEEKYIRSGKKAADQLLVLFNENRLLNGRFDQQWLPSEYMICTGCAQISSIWSKLFRLTGEGKYRDAAERINNQLVHIQRSCLTIQGEGNGALPGSFPIWGKYEPFGFPNWATKYMADALMDEIDHGRLTTDD
jgi:rhamnogalacturonyl hydrolase YesR